MRFLRKTVLPILAALPLLTAQTAFEVASLKPSPPPASGGRLTIVIPRYDGGPGTSDPTRISFHNATVRELITRAYEVRPEQLSGPAWLNAASMFSADGKFDLEAKLAPGTTKPQSLLMLQNLLAERFALKVHRETQVAQVYALTVGKNAPKLKENNEGPQDPEPDVSHPLGPRGEDGFPTMPPGYIGMFASVKSGLSRMKFIRRSMPEFVDWLWGQLKRRVVDRTELKGRYDFYLEFRRDVTSASANGDSGGTDLYGAVQGQLGLKFTNEKGEVEMLVIDHVDRTPSGN
ncbi:conserved exported hypothetical protein [Candidatus Sulfopaludibacter sp. SbA3]|nr:conserved exported hypothetical protein [Candidatus Sulfopaludibacter sp. SbA3]